MNTPLSSDDHTIPHHVAFIMDGNGRWAKQRSKPRIAGHKAGVETVGKIVDFALQKGIKIVSLFAFSTENWQRPTEEINYLMKLFSEVCCHQIEKLNERNIQVRFIGDLSRFSKTVQKDMQQAQARTQDNTGLKLVIAVNYGGQWDLLQATQKIVTEVIEGRLKLTEIDSALMHQHLSTHDLQDPDLLIRTSGEQRISNFFLWQCAYTELYFTETLWPDFDEAAFDQALEAFQNRQRRFGGVIPAKAGTHISEEHR